MTEFKFRVLITVESKSYSEAILSLSDELFKLAKKNKIKTHSYLKHNCFGDF